MRESMSTSKEVVARKVNGKGNGKGGEPISHAVERALIGGDLSGLGAAERVELYRRTCESLGLNPLTKPFDYIRLNGKLTLYAKRDCTDQLRMLRNVSVDDVTDKMVGTIYVVTTHVSIPDAKRPDGLRRDRAKGAVDLKGLSGDALANAIMKAETKSKRRATLSICGLGILDESEVEAVPGAERAVFPRERPEVREVPRKKPPTHPELAEVVFEHEASKLLRGRTLGDIYAEDPQALHRVMASPAKRAGLTPELIRAIDAFHHPFELERIKRENRERIERERAAQQKLVEEDIRQAAEYAELLDTDSDMSAELEWEGAADTDLETDIETEDDR
jgi:hypothetical protein